MPIYVYLAALAFAVSVPLLWWAVAATRGTSQAVARNLAGGMTPVTDLHQIALGRSMADRAVLPGVRASTLVLRKVRSRGPARTSGSRR